MSRTIVVVAALCACQQGTTPKPIEVHGEMANLHAFAELYGVVRWFHPSDEAAAIDWDRYAVVGIRDVRGAHTSAELQRALAAWVAPIGPSVQILGPGQQGTARVVDAKAPQVAWQYEGPGFDGGTGTYKGRRTNRVGMLIDSRAGFGSMGQKVDATPLRGHQVRLRAEVRAGRHASVSAWLRVDREGGAMGFFDNMLDRAVRSAAWTSVTVQGPIAADAAQVVFGGLVTGDEGWFDAFALDVDDGLGNWSPVAITNPNLDDGTKGWETGTGRKKSTSTYTFDAVPSARIGGPAAHVVAPTTELTKDLFDIHPAADEVSTIDLGSGLHAVVPLSLPSVSNHTSPAGDVAKATARTDEIAQMTTSDDAVRIADIIVAWNVLQHFYPYHATLAHPWQTALDGAIAEAIAATTPELHAEALQHLIAAVEDGHGNAISGAQREFLPLDLATVEGTTVVVASNVPDIQRGDVITAIDGVAVADVLTAERARHSGSPQWRQVTALQALGSGPHGTSAKITIEHEGVARTATVARGFDRPPLYTYPPIGEVKPGVWLVDLSRAQPDELEAKLPAIAAARGVIFDIRGYPNQSGYATLRHLVPAAEHDRWMHIPHIIRPNLPGVAGPTYEDVGWDLEPAPPRLTNKVVFLTGPGAISYAESCMGYIESLHLPIIGATTAGTNGDIRPTPLPSGARFIFTGLEVTRHDGTRSHLLGIRPTIPVEPTLAGIRAGKDEVLDRAVAEIK